MSSVHLSRGVLEPAGDALRSEVDIVCSLADATLAPPGQVQGVRSTDSAPVGSDDHHRSDVQPFHLS
jgi:hypothetical protein